MVNRRIAHAAADPHSFSRESDTERHPEQVRGPVAHTTLATEQKQDLGTSPALEGGPR